MSKARQLADLLDSNGDVVVGALDNAPDPDLTPYARTADLLDGSGNIQSGLLGNAPETDLTPVKQDLGILAFESARSDNRSAFSLPNAFVDQFEDSSGIDTTSSAARNSGEYMSASSAVAGLAINKWRVHTSGTPKSVIWQLQYSNDNTNWTNIGSTANTEVTSTWTQYFTFTNETPYQYWRWYKTTTGVGGGWHSQLEIYNGNTLLDDQISAANLSHNGLIAWTAANFLDNDTSSVAFHTDTAGGGAWWKIDASGATTDIVQASGNFTGVTQSASSSVSEMSIVVMYEDATGTASLNTDLVVQVSANNGTDWSTVTLGSAPNLSGSIKVAKSNAVAVTAGTQPKYKISFANQAAGSKVTRILGVSLLY